MTRLLIIVLLAFGHAPGVPGQDDSGELHDSGLTVEVGVSRLFLDVEAVDADGRPIPGLTQEDFTIRLNNREYPIYSVDDLCGCADGDGPLGPSPNFILFFDFSQIGSRWRETALREAERWTNEVKRPEERAMVVAYATPSGLRTLCRLTDDPEKLVASIRDARADSGIDDPFPDRHTQRFENCVDGTVSCHNSGMREYRHTHRSSEVLTRFLMRMGSLPGRKEMLLFYQNNAIYPGCLFATDDSCDAFHDGTSADSVPGLDDIVGEVAGTAVASGTVIYPILSGPATDWSVDFGETLAGLTGGRFNHNSGGISEVVNAAGRDCACMYRIGVQPPPSSSNRVLRVKVAVRDGEWLPHDYRLLQLTEQERWRRNAEAVLLDPESAREIALSAAIVPVAATRRRWDAKVLVTLDPRSLGLLPSGERSVASWDIGAVLVRRGGRGGVEMLGVSRVDCPKAGCTTNVVHERVVEGLHPGTYELRAFAHDRWSNAYGGAKAEIELPAPREPAVVGPVLVAAASRYFSSDLPLRSEKPKDDESSTDRASTAMLPLREGEEPAAALAWVCGDKKAESLPGTTARLWRGETAVALAGEPTIERIGHCWSVKHALDSFGLSPGEYRYELALSAHGETGAARAGFELRAPTPGPESKTAVLVAQADGSAGAPQPASRPAAHPTARAGDSAIEVHPAPGSRDLDHADVRVASPQLPPSDVALEALLEGLARQAEVYRDSALRFTCDETVVETHRGKRRAFEFEYTYAYDDAGRLQDHRMTRRIAERVRKGKALPEPVDPADLGLRTFVLRAYSSIFIFAREYRHLYDFEILGEEQTLGRPAVKVRIAALPPHVDGLNHWFGAAWVDRDTHHLLRFRGLEAEDREAKELYDKGVVQEESPSHRRSHVFDEIDVEFGVRSDELRFPSRVVMVRTEFETSWKASYLRTEAVRDLRTVQSYDNYRIFEVRSAETVEGIIED